MARWGPALLSLGLSMHALRSRDVQGAAAWLAIFALWVIGQFSWGKARRPSRLMAYAINWLAPTLMFAACVYRAVSGDYWGVAFFSVGLGFTLVNAIYLEPSQRRATFYRSLFGLLGVVSAAAIWKTIWP